MPEEITPTLDSQYWVDILNQARNADANPGEDVGAADRTGSLLAELVRLVEAHQAELASVRAEEQKALRQLRSSRAQLVQSGKMAAVGQLAAGVAHEVNNPLQIILSRVQLMMMRNRGQETLVPDLQLIESNVKRISRIIRSLLDFARHNTGEEERQSIDLVHLATQTSNLMQHMVEKSEIEFHLHLPEADLPLIHGNTGEIEQVFLNLLINAQQHTPPAGQIDVSLEARDGRVIVAVQDTGPGIPDENLTQIFEPFFTTREDQGGTGLGLSIIHGIIEKHDARIDVRSRVGEGTTFTVSFPAGVPPPLGAEEA